MLTFLALGLATSILSPIKVEKLTSSVFMSLRQVSPTVGIVGVIVLLLALLLLTTLHYLLGGFIALVAVASMVYLFINYNTLKYRTYNGIHQ
jgi:membrane protein YdbS with pleckstrin-like domain